MDFKRGEEIKDDFYKFETEGTSFFGRLFRVDEVRYKKDEPPQKEYVFQPWRDGSMRDIEMNPIRVRGTTILDRRLAQAQKQKWYEIFYVGEEAKEGGNRMKNFRVYPVFPISDSPLREPGEEG